MPKNAFRIFNRCTLAVVVAGWLSAAMSATAQESQPTLDQTMEWLSNVLRTEALTFVTSGYIDQRNGIVLSYRGCTITKSQTSRAEKEDGSKTLFFSDEATFNLGTIDPDAISIRHQDSLNYWSITLPTTNSVKAIRSTSRFNEEITNEEQSQTSLAIQSEEMAGRIANALRHAVRLCGGKKSLF